MLAIRLVRLIEEHAREIADNLITALRASERTPGYRKLSDEETSAATLDVYVHLSEWLLNKSVSEIERHFTAVGARRAEQGIPSSQLAWALFLAKAQLWNYINSEPADRAFELYSELDLLARLDGFFDRAVYYALVGYEQSGRAEKAA